MDIDMSALRMLETERDIPLERIIPAIEQAILTAYHKSPGSISRARAELDRSTGKVTIWAPEVEEDGTVIGEFDDTPNGFGRVAASTARQLIQQRLREAEDDTILGEFKDKVGEILSGVIQQGRDPRVIKVDLGSVEASLPPSEQAPGEDYRHGRRLRSFVVRVERGFKGPQVTLSRTHPGLVKKLFELEVPEIQSGQVEIVALAREAGHRSKIAVSARVAGINAKGACIGEMGTRVRAVTAELNDEKIDIVDFDKDPAAFIAHALSPAKVTSVTILDESLRAARVIVPDDQLSLAIGKEGQNARLAAKLTGWRIDIKPQSRAESASAAAAGSGDGER
ncbi:transcription termination factor NusA [Falsarthrobacter nasiphocae]|uniref:Transcription termination/antitermination protein NusA n=1 Tax=Falsarthrobacter nasiphocae TaxID=189863 RepID=A0AAE3YGB4_9MICC|nr:transcription termination factor NusA [Falsarthrobacter nasiphocae]MDR6892650.1 N utilization substance protein A [Falsarthrobacter nasiphocae]